MGTIRTATIAMAAVGLVAAACGGDDSDTGTATTAAAATSEAAATTAAATTSEAAATSEATASSEAAATTTAEVTTTEAAAADTSATSEASPSSSVAPSPPTGPFTDEEMAHIDAAAMASLTNGTTGTVVSIVDPERGTFLKAYGTADTAGTPMSPDMHYRIGSVTKTFTAEAVLRLVDQGLVALGDPIAMYVDDIPNGDVITIQDLLAMRSGLFEFADDQDFYNKYIADPTLPWTTEDTLAIIRANADKATAPNTTTAYNDGNYIILGLVIERVTGQTVHEHLTGLIAELGLTNTSFPTSDTLPEPYASGYYSDGTTPPPAGGYRDTTVQTPVIPGSAGAIISTVPDMTRYAAELDTGAGLSPETWQARQTWSPASTTGVRLQYGLGIIQLGDWLGHDGSLFGYSNMVFYLPSEEAVVVVMGNAADQIAVPSQALWGDVVKLLYPDSLPFWP